MTFVWLVRIGARQSTVQVLLGIYAREYDVKGRTCANSI